MVEYEKYHELQTKCQKMQDDYDRQLQAADAGKQQSLEELTEFYETKLQEKSLLLEQVLIIKYGFTFMMVNSESCKST